MRLPTAVWCGSLMACASPVTVARRGSRGVCPARSSAAIVQLRNDTEGRAYYRRRLSAGKTPMEAIRCLKRRLSDLVYKQMVNDAKAATGPGGHAGATFQSSAADPIPEVSSSEQSLPGPAENHSKTLVLAAS